MKRLIISLFLIFGLFLSSYGFEREARAQYYGYAYGATPGFYYSCLKGPYCPKSYKAATIATLSINAVDTALAVHDYYSAREEQVKQAQYQAAAAQMNPQQMMVDYSNMLRVAPFFNDVTLSQAQDKNFPKVKSITKSSKEIKP